MIRLTDAVLLARTKLRTRRIRLGVLLVTMSLLFAGLVFIASVASGTVHSLQSFSEEGFGGRFLVQAHPITYTPYDNQTLVEQLKAKQSQLVGQKTAAAKKLGVNYDPKTDQDLYYTDQQVGPNPSDVQAMLTNSPLASRALDNQNKSVKGILFDDFAQRARQAGATGEYRSVQSAGMSSPTGNLSVLVDGKEDYNSQQSKPQYGEPTGVKSIQTLGWNQMDSALLKPFLLDGQTTAAGKDGSLPIVAPFSAAEQILDLTKLPATATAAQRLQRLVDVRQNIAGKTAQLCYRNQASQDLLQKAIQQQAANAANKGKKDYVPEALQYNLPASSCGAVTVKSDKRSADEKKAADNEQSFKDAFSSDSKPEQGIVTIRIVGISPDVSDGSTSLSAGSILTNIFSSSIGYGWFSPTDVFTAGSLAAKAQGGTLADRPISSLTYYAEFSTLQAATGFMKQIDCYTNQPDSAATASPNSAVVNCSKAGRPFVATPFGNNAGAIADFQHSIWKVLRFVLLGVVVIAVVIMMGTFGKVIADSRRETAVFRSLGASRLAISQIYLTYTLMVCGLVAIFAFVIGTLGAELLNHHFGPGLSVSAVLTYNAHDIHKQFSIAGFNGLYLLAILGLIIASALVSALIPLVLNMRRNPIRDMRDE